MVEKAEKSEKTVEEIKLSPDMDKEEILAIA